MFNPNWDFFIEYDHMWLGTKTYFFNPPGGGALFIMNARRDLDTVLVGLNYRFSGK